jgi:hypothetical protein
MINALITTPLMILLKSLVAYM